MPFWPFYMVAAFGLAIWGYRAGAWVAPVSMLAGLIGMRVIAWSCEPALHAIAACTLWLFIAMFLAHKRACLPAFFLSLSGMSYGVFWLLGVRFEYLSLMLVFADVFWWLAMLSVGGGLLATGGNNRRVGAGFRDRLASVALGMAARQGGGVVAVEVHSEIEYDPVASGDVKAG